MRKIFSACTLFLLIMVMLIFFISSSSENNKISPDIYKNLEKNNEIKVIVELNEISKERGFLIKKEKNESEIELEKKEIKDDIIEKIGEENIRHVFEKELALEVSREDINELKENPDIKSIRIDRIISAFLQDSVTMINASTSWQIKISSLNLTGINETICVLDTGANFSHPDLIGKNKTCVIDCVSKACVENCSISDDHGHGTHVAGIAAASNSINGVAIGANLISVKVLDASGSGTDSDLNAGIEWCINNSALYNISVMSISLGTNCIQTPQYCYDHYCDNEPNEASIALRVNNATAKNISMIIAAGNNGNRTHISSPACIQNATSVGWANKDNTIAANANRNNITDLFAPGTSINSTFRGSSCLSGCSCSGNYMTCSGSSMSAPHVSGAFAIIRQFFRAQNNRAPTPSEIQDTLNNTGKIIFDSSSGLNFSRIDIYSALISIDYLNPNVNLSNPINGTNQISKNLTFNCIADDVKLSNITLYIWNSTGIYNNTITTQTNSIISNIEFNLTNISSDTYQWNCLVYDHKSNFSFSSTNFSFQIYNIISALNSPNDNYYSKQDSVNFNCSGETENTNTLTNMTFYLWNSTHLIYNLTENISGNINSTIFNYNFTSQLNYSWNCLFSNNISRLTFADRNYSIIYDSTKPVINLINPSGSSSYTSSSQSITFSYNVSDNFNLRNCSLVINNIITSTNSSINQNQEQNFSQTFTPENYLWRINCTDLAGNEENSSQRSFVVNSSPSQTVSALGGGGGGGEPAYNTYVLSSNETSRGYTKELKSNDRIKFSFFDNKAFEHIITINEVKTNSVNISIQSKTINLILGIGQSVKINLTSPDYYDLYIKLDSIESKKATLTIQLINEPIPKFQEEPGEKTINKTSEAPEKRKEAERYGIEKFKNNIFIFVIIFIIIFSIIILILKKSKNKKRGKKIKEYSEIFNKNIRPKKENLYKRNLIIKE